MFNIEAAINSYKIDSKQAEQIVAEVSQEYKNDQMLAELHIIRALRNYAKKARAAII